MQITSIADETFRELDEPCDTSVPSIAFWYQSNVGKMNDLLGVEYFVAGGQISPPLSDDEKVIFKKLYEITYIQRQVRKNLGAAALTSFVEIKEGGRLVKRTNRTEIAKAYNAMLTSLKDDLETLVVTYKVNRCAPQQFIVANPTTYEDFTPAGAAPPFYPRMFTSLDFTRAI